MTPKRDETRKAWRITTKAHNDGGYSIVSDRTAGEAKTHEVNSIREAYCNANYSWVISCRRAPEYDELARTWPGTIAWRDPVDRESWEIDRGHWHDYEKKPMSSTERIMLMEAEVFP